MADPQDRPDDGNGAAGPAPKKAPAKKAPAKKAPAKKAPAKAPAKKAPAKKAPAKKAPAKKAPAKTAGPHPIPVPPPAGAARPVQDAGNRVPISIGLAAAGLFAVVLRRFRRG